MIMTRGKEKAEVKDKVQEAAFKNEGWTPSEGKNQTDEPEVKPRKPREK